MKEQLPAQLEAELLLFDFPRKIIPTFIFCTPFLLVSIAEEVKETEDFFTSFMLVCWILSCKWLTVHLKSEEGL